MSSLIFFSNIDRGREWAESLKRDLPWLNFRNWDAPGDDGDVEYALVWKPPQGELKRRFPKLKAILSLGAGVDHIFADTDLPEGVPVIRMVDPGLKQGMVEYALLYTLSLHRLVPALEAQQRAHDWTPLVAPPAQDRKVGVMGLGVLGGAIAQTLAGVGFSVRGWARREKELAGVECHAGADGLDAFLTGLDILICVLPMTEETRGILNADLFAKLPMGAGLINMGRGGQQVEDDILAALDSGQLGHVVLDVFQTEPLPQDHPFWSHPKVTITPHIAAITHPSSGARVVAGSIADVEAGRRPANIVIPRRAIETMMDIRFRPAREADVPAIVAMLADDGLGAGREDASLPLDPRYLEAFRVIDAERNQLLVIAETPQGEPIGTMQLTFLPGISMKGMWRAQVEAVRIAAPYRGKGLGQIMMAWAEDQARARGCGVMQLTTHNTRKDAHRFYERLGFHATHQGMKKTL